MFGQDGLPEEQVSLRLGAVVLTERYLAHDPPTRDELAALRAAVTEALVATPIRRLIGPDGARGPLVGSGGTLLTLGAMAARLDCYRGELVHGMELRSDSLRASRTELEGRTIAERCAIPGLDSGRAPMILAGAILADAVLTASGAHAYVLSDQGLRHAVLRERFAGSMATDGSGRSVTR